MAFEWAINSFIMFCNFFIDGKMRPVLKPSVAPSPKADMEAGSKEDAGVVSSVRSTSTTVRDEGFSDVTFWRLPLPVLEDSD